MPELTAEIAETLKEYTQIQQEELRLKERKQALQEKLKTHLRRDDTHVWFPEVSGMRLKVSYRSVTQVEYNEENLRARLGNRYRTLLEPDLKKLRAELLNLGNELEPLLERIGSPSPERVKAAVEAGTVSTDEFRGAFTKTVKEYISVVTLQKHDEL
jgi:DNA repair exonuclease SbcCD ATPase subunit